MFLHVQANACALLTAAASQSENLSAEVCKQAVSNTLRGICNSVAAKGFALMDADIKIGLSLQGIGMGIRLGFRVWGWQYMPTGRYGPHSNFLYHPAPWWLG